MRRAPAPTDALAAIAAVEAFEATGVLVRVAVPAAGGAGVAEGV